MDFAFRGKFGKKVETTMKLYELEKAKSLYGETIL